MNGNQRREPVPPGYKMTEVGVIPEDWGVRPLGDLYSLQNGYNADGTAYGSGVRFVNVLEPITYSHLSVEDLVDSVHASEQIVASYRVKSGDVVFNRTSETRDELGLAAVFEGRETAIFGGFVIRGRPRTTDVDPIYSGYALRSQFIRRQIIPMGQGAIRANIGQTELRRVLFPLPPLPEQRAIAEALSDVDNLLDALDRLISKKRAVKQAVMQQLLTGKTRLPGFAGEWEETTLGEIANSIVGGGTPDRETERYWGGPIPWITVKDLTDGGLQRSPETITAEGIAASATRLVSSGTLVVSTRMALGKVAIFPMDVCINQDLKAIYLKYARADSRFMYYRAILTEKAFSSKAGGSTVAGIGMSDLRSMGVFLPPLPEQRAIAEVLADIDDEITALEKRRDKTRHVKEGMMQQLLTGRVRLVPRAGADAPGATS